MSDLRKAAEMALDALHNIDQSNNYDAIEALRQALAQDSLRKLAEIDRELGLFDEPKQPEQDSETVMAKYEFQTYAAYKVDGEIKIGVVPEPKAWVTAGRHTAPLELALPKREWVGLTDDEIHEMTMKIRTKNMGVVTTKEIFRDVEAKLKEKNNG